MSKVIQAVNAMIVNSEKISDVYRNNKEYFFIYENKYKWSINNTDDKEYILFYYPLDNSIKELAALEGDGWESLIGSFISYSTKEIKTKEAYESFSELYQIVKERVLGINKVFDDIIKGL